MKRRTKIFSVLFLIVVVLHIFGLLYNETLDVLTKPFLTIFLAIVYLSEVEKPSFWYISALFFSFWGDIFLLFKDQFFLFGLVSFLVAHVLYIKISSGYLNKVGRNKIITTSIPFVALFGSIVFVIKDNLGDILIPVIIYGIIISAFGTIALLNYLQKKNTENLWLFLGAIIFIISDSFLAINKFHEPREVYGVTIMITYIVAQYLICKAMILKQKRDQN